MTRWSSVWSDRLPAPVKIGLRQAAYGALNLLARLTGRTALRPPAWMPLVGTGAFDAVGQEYFGYFTQLAGLRPGDQVLDVGCGMGRMALPLTGYLDPAAGRYTGFDIDPGAIRWCQAQITPRYPHFTFQHVPVINRNYQLTGAAADRFRFPYPDAAFDFVIATSLFTHMLPADAQNYLDEIARVLRPGGRGLLTFFLLNPEAEACLAAGRGHLDFQPGGRYRLVNPELPETAVAHAEAEVRGWLAHSGLGLVEPMHYGNWCGRDRFVNGQDIVILHR